MSWVVVDVDGIRLGLAADVAQEIGALSRLGAVPHAPAYLMGLALVRGEPVPVVDLAGFLGLSPLGSREQDGDRAARVLMIATGGYRVGLAVPRVIGLRRCLFEELTTVEIAPAGKVLELALGEFDAADGIVTVLDADRLLSEARVRAR